MHNDYEKIFRRMIILCWSLLCISLVLKIIGLDWFGIQIQNQRFIAFCDMIESTWILKYIVCVLSSLFTYTLYWMAIAERTWYKNNKEIMLCFGTVIICTAFKLILHNEISLVFDLVLYFAVPIMLTKNFKRTTISFVILFIFGFATNLIKGLSNFSLRYDNYAINIVSAIDLYLMLLLYYFYSNKRRK